MVTFWRTATVGVAATLLLVGVTANAQAFLGFGQLWSGVGRTVQLKGKVVCTGCSLEEARQAQPHRYANHLYLITSQKGQAVLEVDWLSNPHWLSYLTTPHVQVRGDDSLVGKMMEQENVQKEIEVSGRLANPRTVDVTAISIRE
jgi:hypothetical protein